MLDGDTRDTDLVVVVNPTERTLNRLPVEQRLGRLRGDVPASAVMLAQKLSNILSSDDNVRMIRVILNELMFEEVATARHLALSLVRERVYLPHVHVRLDPPIIPRPERASAWALRAGVFSLLRPQPHRRSTMPTTSRPDPASTCINYLMSLRFLSMRGQALSTRPRTAAAGASSSELFLNMTDPSTVTRTTEGRVTFVASKVSDTDTVCLCGRVHGLYTAA